MRILVAEDERVTRATLVRQLQAWGHEVVTAEDGQQAWERFDAAGEGDFDIVLTDWEMPRVSGVELVRRIRAATRSVYTYVIILTSRNDKADVVSGIEAGADDYVSKPFDRDELRVRVLAGERVVRLERALGRQNAELREASERIRIGLRSAARVQQSMLPRHDVVTPSVRTAWKYVPTDELAGDAVGLHLIDHRYLVAYVLDVSGHGVPAALLSVSAMYALAPDPPDLSILRLPAQPGAAWGTIQRPARIASELNRRFCAGENDGRFLTMGLCVLDTRDGRLHMTSAGHPPPMLLRAGEVTTLPDTGGFPLGMVDGTDYDDSLFQLQPGDRVCLFSDGIIEQTDPAAREEFGKGRLARSLVTHAAAPASRVVDGIVQDLAAWAGSASFADDVSLVIVDWCGPDR